MTFKNWQEFSDWLKSLPSNQARIDALFDDSIVILEAQE